jgi:hypothetical protein
MTDVIAASDVDLNDSASSARFYVVSQKKFTVLFLATLGIYSFYWWYKQWSCYKDGSAFESEEHDVWPVPRALFPVFFTHSLFREVNRFSQAGAALDKWQHSGHATFLVVLMVVSNVLDRLSWKSIGAPYTDVLSLVFLLPLLSSFSKAQAMINISCADPEGAANCTFTSANYAWIAIGCICWVLVLIGLFLPESP